MHLFISSFNKKILKSITLTCIALFLYSYALQKKHPVVTTFQNQWVANYAVAEKFIYAQNPASVVIVGSSMSALLYGKAFSSDVYNLSFSGESALTGLNVLKRSAILPKKIFIETNILEKKLSTDMVDSLFTPLIWRIKGNFLSFQYTYQPINVFLTFLKNSFGSSEELEKNNRPNEKILKAALERYLANESSIGSFINNHEFDELQNLVAHFENKGVEVIFFQMPVDKKILLSRRYAARKAILLALFPDSNFYWVKSDNDYNYQTADGVHLMFQSAVEYSAVLGKYFTSGM